ncbi:MAG: CcmD family protein [Spirosomataceae bacterium]
MKKLIGFLSFFLLSTNLFAQQDVEMADQLRADGKIWVVITVISVVFLGLIIYLITLDKKISKLEKELKK